MILRYYCLRKDIGFLGGSSEDIVVVVVVGFNVSFDYIKYKNMFWWWCSKVMVYVCIECSLVVGVCSLFFKILCKNCNFWMFLILVIYVY